jgi:hypothetical protein
VDEQAFIDETKPLEVDFGAGRILHVEYRPNAIKLKDQGVSDTSADAVAEIIGRMIASWDLTRGGEPVPLTVDGLKETPVNILAKVQEAVLGDMQVPQM